MIAQLPPVPINSPVLQPGQDDPNKKNPFGAKLYRDLVNFLNTLRTRIGSTAQLISSVNLSAQSASIAATDIPTPTLSAGLYRVSYCLGITRAATTSSSVAVTFGWTRNSTSCSQAFAPLTGNALSSQTSDDISVSIDAGTPIQYSVTYGSVGATSATFDFDVSVEAIL